MTAQVILLFSIILSLCVIGSKTSSSSGNPLDRMTLLVAIDDLSQIKTIAQCSATKRPSNESHPLRDTEGVDTQDQGSIINDHASSDNKSTVINNLSKFVHSLEGGVKNGIKLSTPMASALVDMHTHIEGLRDDMEVLLQNVSAVPSRNETESLLKIVCTKDQMTTIRDELVGLINETNKQISMIKKSLESSFLKMATDMDLLKSSLSAVHDVAQASAASAAVVRQLSIQKQAKWEKFQRPRPNYASAVFYYKTISIKVDWETARAFCRGQRGYLAVIETRLEEDVLHEALSKAPAFNWIRHSDTDFVWLGATDEHHEGQWVWETNESLPLNSSFWERTFPTRSAASNCLVFGLGSKRGLYDAACSNLYPFVCETAYPQ